MYWKQQICGLTLNEFYFFSCNENDDKKGVEKVEDYVENGGSPLPIIGPSPAVNGAAWIQKLSSLISTIFCRFFNILLTFL